MSTIEVALVITLIITDLVLQAWRKNSNYKNSKHAY